MGVLICRDTMGTLEPQHRTVTTALPPLPAHLPTGHMHPPALHLTPHMDTVPMATAHTDTTAMATDHQHQSLPPARPQVPPQSPFSAPCQGDES